MFLAIYTVLHFLFHNIHIFISSWLRRVAWAMAEDREILREVWDGRVPVSVQLASEDCSTLSAPDSYYLMVPRLSYFPLVMDKVYFGLVLWIQSHGANLLCVAIVY